MNEITIGDKVYISAKRAAEITGYARDYVGQLCREGHVDAKMVGRSWYVYEPAIRAHRFGPEAVEAPEAAPAAPPPPQTTVTDSPSVSGWQKPTYTPEKPELLPELDTPALEDLLPPPEETLTDMQAAWREWFEERQITPQKPVVEAPATPEELQEAPEATPEPVKEEEDVSIPLHRIQEEPEEEVEEEEVVPIRTISSSTPPIRPQHVDIAPVRKAVHMPAYRPHSAAPSSLDPVSTRYIQDIPAVEEGRIVSERIIRSTPSKAVNSTHEHVRGSHAPLIAFLVSISVISLVIAFIGTGYATRYFKSFPAQDNPIIKYLVGTQEYTR